MLKPITALAAMVMATAVVAPTVSQAAAPDSTPDSVRVSYADLNLATAKGQVVLGRRISQAATVVCDASTPTRDFKVDAAGQLCRAGAIDRAQPAYLAAIDAARHGTVTVLDAAALIVTAK